MIKSNFASKEDRDAMISDGMERGVRDGYQKRDALLARRKSQA